MTSLTRVFPRETPVAYFPALDVGSLFSRGEHRLHVFPRLAAGQLPPPHPLPHCFVQSARFPEVDNCCKFLEHFSNACRKTKTKLVTLINYNRHKLPNNQNSKQIPEPDTQRGITRAAEIQLVFSFTNNKLRKWRE